LWSATGAELIEPIYTAQFVRAVYVLHIFQKKAKRGIATPKREIDLVRQRLVEADRDHGKKP
jgi:phage-related protein